MKTYQDLLEIGNNEKLRIDFIRTVINEHRASPAYRIAVNAEKYYAGENPTIMHYEKIIYDIAGNAHVDEYAANHKIASKFFGFAVDQASNYLLGNGVTFTKPETKEKLGNDFDINILNATTAAAIEGLAFVFWNYDGTRVFRFTEFAPLYDEENGALMAGVRFWQVAPGKPLRATLYEIDGYTEYLQREGEDMQILQKKRRYVQIVRKSEITGVEIYDGENYPGFPIVPLKNGELGKSELCGRRNTIDALDLAISNMVNNVDEGNLIYWAIQNAGGMDEEDDAEFIRRIQRIHVAHTNEDTTAEPHAIEAPFAGTEATIDILKKQLYEDFQAFDSSAVSAGNQTATAIQASYVPLDLKCDKIETEVTRCINGILQLAGIDDKPTYERNRIINRSEEIQTILMGAQYLDDEYIIKKILTIMGDADQYDEIMQRHDAEDMERLDAVDIQGQQENAAEMTNNANI